MSCEGNDGAFGGSDNEDPTPTDSSDTAVVEKGVLRDSTVHQIHYSTHPTQSKIPYYGGVDGTQLNGNDLNMENNPDINVPEVLEPQKISSRQVVYGLLIVIGIVASWTGATQLVYSSLAYDKKHFYAPYFIVWFNTAFMVSCFPVYVAGILCMRQSRGPKLHGGFKAIIRHCTQIFGSRGLCILSVITRAVPFLILWILANYFYSQALGHVNAAETTAVFSSNLAFVSLLSWIFLPAKLTFFKVSVQSTALLLSTGGIILMAFGSGLQEFTLIGVLFAVASAFTAALYKVFFKRMIVTASIGQVSLFLSVMGLVNLFLNWTVVLALALTGEETLKWGFIPWKYVASAGSLSLVFNFLVNFGIAVTDPLFISVGIFLGMPANALIDWLIRQHPLDLYASLGSVLILFGFLLLLLPIHRLCDKRNFSRQISKQLKVNNEEVETL